MKNKYNVLIKYSGDSEFKFVIKKIGEVSITKTRPVYIYNADVDTINNLRALRRMLIEITIGAKPTGAYKIYNMDDFNKSQDALKDARIVADRRGFNEAVSNNEVKSILSSGTNGPIEIDEPIKKDTKTEEVIEEDKPKKARKSTKKSTKKTTKK